MQRSYHFIGIGGVGMSALAHILLQKGAFVSGSDLSPTEVTCELEREGCQIFYGQRAENIKAGQIVVYSTAINPKNPEFCRAGELKCESLHRSQLLKRLMEGEKEIIVTGSHGKTTTTAFLAYVLEKCGLDPSYAIGGFSPSLQAHGHSGSGEYFLAEGDESDGSFLETKPFGAILTNIDFDHFNYWKREEALVEGFLEFTQKVESDELFLYCEDDPYLSTWNLKGLSYGFSPKAGVRGQNIRYESSRFLFDVHMKGKDYFNLISPMMGRHNLLNTLAVFAMAVNLGASEELLRQALASFKGVKRRLEYRGKAYGATLYDDYAHHPKEIEEVLETFKPLQGEQRVVIVFQPHRYTRMKHLMDGFIEALQGKHELIITDIYSAGEEPLKEASMELFMEKMRLKRDAYYVKREQLAPFLSDFIKPEDIVITLGAGDITKVSRELECQRV